MNKFPLIDKSRRIDKNKITLILADDHPLLRKALKSVLEMQTDFQVIAEASDGEEAVNLTVQHSPDIVIMDISMPKMNGLDAIRQIKAQKPEVIILVLTVHDETEHILGMLEAGASGYLTKGVFDEEVIHAVRSVAAGETVLSTEVSKQILQHARRHTTKPIQIDTIEKLTVREMEILNLVARGMKNKDIAQELNLGLPTIKVYLSDIFSKLKVRSRTEAVMVGIQIGLINVSDTYQSRIL